MTFAFFLGAGNIIFPPKAGYMAGEHMSLAMLGFLITGVGLPLLGIVAVAFARGGLPVMTRLLPSGVALLFGVVINVTLGAALVCPRAGLVAYEMGIHPFFPGAGHGSLLLFSVLFFGLSTVLALTQGRLLDAIGKVLTPLLIILLLVLAFAVFIAPQGGTPAAVGDYVAYPFSTGFLQGYNTMDIFASLMFGMLIIDVLKARGVQDGPSLFKYLAYAGIISAMGLVFVYLSLFYLGATSLGVAPATANGGNIIAAYVMSLFGQPGLIILAAIVLLACLTTAIGLISASSDFLHQQLGLMSYRKWVLLSGVCCILVSNVGLSELIKLSSPLLVFCYPLVITLVLLTFVRPKLARPEFTYKIVLGVGALFSLCDGLRSIHSEFPGSPSWFALKFFDAVPLAEQGLAWVLPTAVTLLLCMLTLRFVQSKTACAVSG
ncbi:branched-chain amino acid transport system II carrier protein [Dongshaea marina]|uniref:branched-chain amino acid transport system II carrier protein n=1 Tax=Dongshaea marina TaxID=2047966 RepID=UPI001F2F9D86|nr:branched-chain amino acid transport system II carrier protein [Dongshaea marina]